ncbi:hypothetical protein O181_035224 [Austropuccinia psidii MF-1]|uniref:Uncharacterized protein n=1 Tax=Austropuccinia psidii MF-1 TaxID=1389203 RepID=A0A9Q3D2B8_9BASI|nr:hypothetical protein [Austropuccinia psidii MF-1]
MLKKELRPPQEASVDIFKASQKAYNNAFQHKEYQIITDLWKNCMNSYLTVRTFLGHPNTCKLLNGWHPLMEQRQVIILTAEWRKNNPTSPNKVPRTASEAGSSHKLRTRAKAKHQLQNLTARDTESQRFSRMLKKVYQVARTMMELQNKEPSRLKYQKSFLIFSMEFQTCT